MPTETQADRINAHLAKVRPVYVWFYQGARWRVTAARMSGTKLEVQCLEVHSWCDLDPTNPNHRIEFGK
jgi:hypothetical protein